MKVYVLAGTENPHEDSENGYIKVFDVFQNYEDAENALVERANKAFERLNIPEDRMYYYHYPDGSGRIRGVADYIYFDVDLVLIERELIMQTLYACYVPHMNAYRLYDISHPEQTVAYYDTIEEAEREHPEYKYVVED